MVFSRNCHSALRSQFLFTAEELDVGAQLFCKCPQEAHFTPKGGHILEDFPSRTFFFHERTCSWGCGGAWLEKELASPAPGPEARRRQGWPG